MREKWDAFMGRAGFFVTMAICLLVAGVSGYFLLFDKEDTPPSGDALVIEETTAPAPEVTEPEESPPAVVETISAEPVVIETTSMPEVEIDDTPVVAEAPKLLVAPLKGDVLTVFSMDALVYNETLGDWRTHDGVDIAAAAGTSVLAACAGTVTLVEDDPLMGTTVVLDHADGYQTTYANLQTTPPVAVGDTVSAGEVIGTVGSTAVAETAQGTHLHFSVTLDGTPFDPNKFLE